MNRIDRRAIEGEQRGLNFALSVVIDRNQFVVAGASPIQRSSENAFEQLANSCAQFCSRFFGESDDQDLFDRTGRLQEKIQNEMLDGMSLAGAGVCFDNHMTIMRNLF